MICKRGSVHLVGAGPGDPNLITVKGLRLLETADVVIHDRLIPSELLESVRENAEVIDVGKYPDHHRITQEQINALLVDRAARGKTVVRLKGGDPFVFGRGTEEIEACRDHEIPYFVVPGISSSIAAPSSVGIPVTSRGIARSFAVVTGQTDPHLGDYQVEFESLAKIDTVIFLMGRKNLANLIENLLDAGKPADLPVACIERATMSDQKAVIGTMSDIVDRVESQGMSSPMVTVVGEVASLGSSHLIDSMVEETWQYSPRSSQPSQSASSHRQLHTNLHPQQ